LNNKFVYVPVRALLAAIRTFPSILWAILFVIIVGLGPFAGVLAIIMYTVGFIAKLQYEAIEAIDADPMDAVGAIGVSKLQLIRFVVLPESASHLLSQILYIFDYNIRQTSILGLVGAGGIGFYIINYIKFFEYGKAAIFMLVGSPTIQIPEVIFFFFNSLISKGAPWHAVSSSKVKEKCISLSRLLFAKIGA